MRRMYAPISWRSGRTSRYRAGIVPLGQEGKTTLRDYQTRLGHIAIDGRRQRRNRHHPHILQGIEQYKDGLILYSLGKLHLRLIQHEVRAQRCGPVALPQCPSPERAIVSDQCEQLRGAVPAQPLTGTPADAVIEGLRTLSAALNTRVQNENGTGVVTLVESMPVP